MKAAVLTWHQPLVAQGQHLGIHTFDTGVGFSDHIPELHNPISELRHYLPIPLLQCADLPHQNFHLGVKLRDLVLISDP